MDFNANPHAFTGFLNLFSRTKLDLRAYTKRLKVFMLAVGFQPTDTGTKRQT